MSEEPKATQSIDIEIDEDVFRVIKSRAAETGKSESQVAEEAIRRALQLDALKDVQAHTKNLSEDAAMDLALEAQGAAQKQR